MKKLVPLVVDALLVILFCVIGRQSHDEAVLTGLLRTFWPFGVGLAIGWLVALAAAKWIYRDVRFDGTALWPTGILVWLGTLCGGLLLRLISGQGVSGLFPVIAAAALALFLLGWRAAIKALN
ncbi:DUF3054 domain-containing protein [Nocardia sp. NPDC052566]|uniref:DUF3054 domain-containing protein n=1 Tax=Nocardia sp. NPDC052566 TaxID=3364330 RepID=UPI0037C67B64